MSPAERSRVLAELRRRVARLEHNGRATPSIRAAHLPFGVPTLDARLPGGGLRRGALHEVAPGSAELAHAAASALFVAGILTRLPGPVLWCLSARDLFAPGLSSAGLHPDRVLYAETFRDSQLLPLVEEGARFPGLAAVVGEVAKVGLTASRRLQLAAEQTGVTVFLLRRAGRHASGKSDNASAAVTRWRVSVQPSAPLAVASVGRGRWRVELVRCRGALAGTDDCAWLLEACDEAGCLALPAYLADRSRASARPECAAAG